MNSSYKKLDAHTMEHVPKVTSIPFEYAPSGHIVIQVGIDDTQNTYPFILDSGAANYLFENYLGQQSPKTTGRTLSMDTNGAFSFPKIYEAPYIGIGDITLRNVGFKYTEQPFQCYDHIYGLIGANIMRHFVWQIDYQNQLIHISKERRHLPVTPDKESAIGIAKNKWGHQIYTSFAVGDKKGQFTIDLGSNSVLTIPLKKIDSSTVANGRELLGIGSSGLSSNDKESKKYVVTIDTLKLGKEKRPFTNVETYASNSSSFTAIGNGFLKHFLITLDYPEKQLYLQDKNDQPFVHRTQSVGFQFDDGLSVRSVFKHSNAYALGIRPEMDLISINGVVVKNETEFCELRRQLKHLNTITIRIQGKPEAVTITNN
ncbi:hypothetical protein [Sungkyunkwania multivorans]